MQQNSSMQFLIELCKKTLINAARRNYDMIISQFGPQHNFIHLSKLMRKPTFTCHDCDLVFGDIFAFIEHSYEKEIFDSNESWQLQYTEDKFCKLCLTYKKSKIDLIYHIVKHIEDAYNLKIPYNNDNQREIADTRTSKNVKVNHPERNKKLYNTEYNPTILNSMQPRSDYYKNDQYIHKEDRSRPQNDQHRPQNYHRTQNDQHRLQNNQHRPQNDQHHRPQNYHRTQNDQQKLHNGQYIPKSDQHRPQNYHRTQNNQHRLQNNQHRPQNDQHRLQNGQYIPRNDQHRPQNDQHRLQNGQYIPRNDQHRLQNGQHRLQNDLRLENVQFIPQNGPFRPQNEQYREQNYATKPNRDREKNEKHTSQFSIETTLIPSHQYRTMIPHFRVVLNEQNVTPTYIPIPVIDMETCPEDEAKSTNNRMPPLIRRSISPSSLVIDETPRNQNIEERDIYEPLSVGEINQPHVITINDDDMVETSSDAPKSQQNETQKPLRKKQDHYKAMQKSKDYQCKFCHRSFHRFTDVKKHVQKYDTKCTPNISCDTCARVYKSRKLCYKHAGKCEEIHLHETKKFHCEKCGKSFSRFNYLTVHLKYGHDDNIQCLICDRWYRDMVSLKEHKRLIHNLY